MSNSSETPTSVLAAAIVAIGGSVLTLLGLLIGSLGLMLLPTATNGPQIPAFARSMMGIFLLLFLGIAVLGIFTGIGLIRLRNWARISALVWAGISVFFSTIILISTLLMRLPTMPNAPAAPDMGMVRMMLVAFYGLPLLIGIWWLILFNTKTVKAQFAGEIGEGESVTPTKPRCPLPVAVVAGFFLFSVFSVVIVLFMRLPTPFVAFGRVIRGSLGTTLFFLTIALLVVGAIGLLKLKNWSYPLILGLQIFWFISGLVTFLSPNYESLMNEILADAHYSSEMFHSENFVHQIRLGSIAGLLGPIVIISILLFYRKRFQEASAVASSQA